MIEITDLQAKDLQVFSTLTDRELHHINEPAPGLFLAEGANVVRRALDAGYAPMALLLETPVPDKFLDITSRVGDIPVYGAPLSVLERLVGYHLTGGVICAMHRKPVPAPEALLAKAKKLVVLQDVTNPTNVGAILRSAAALFADAVLLTESCADPLYRRALRVGMGCAFQVPWTVPDARYGKYADLPSFLRTLGFTSVALALRDDARPVGDPALKAAEKTALFFGSEGAGLPAETIASCDYTAKIPMAWGVDSLNVAAAAAVALYALFS